jgi:hypothetical protein
MRELESETSEPAARPLDHCPAAIKPPGTVTFSALDSVLLDVAATTERRRSMVLADCCYSWCSQVPPGTVLKAQPKTK